jgi:hypothetical protein
VCGQARSPRLHGYPPRSFQRSWGAGEGCATRAPAPRSRLSAQMYLKRFGANRQKPLKMQPNQGPQQPRQGARGFRSEACNLRRSLLFKEIAILAVPRSPCLQNTLLMAVQVSSMAPAVPGRRVDAAVPEPRRVAIISGPTYGGPPMSPLRCPAKAKAPRSLITASIRLVQRYARARRRTRGTVQKPFQRFDKGEAKCQRARWRACCTHRVRTTLSTLVAKDTSRRRGRVSQPGLSRS